MCVLGGGGGGGVKPLMLVFSNYFQFCRFQSSFHKWFGQATFFKLYLEMRHEGKMEI